MSVAASRLSTTGRPSVRFGTKWLSITSTCSQSAPLTAAASSASREKSAARIDGAIIGRDMGSPYFRSARRRTSRRCRAGAATAARTGRRRDRRRRSNSGRASSAVTGWRRSASATTPTVSARCGEHVAYSTTPPGRVSSIADASSSRCSRASAGTSRGLAPPARLRPCGAARRGPVHGASTSTRSKPGSSPESRPSTRTTSTGSPRVFCSTNSARRGVGLDRGHPGARLAPDARPAARSCRPGPRTGPASGRRRPSTGASVSARATSWLPSSCTSACAVAHRRQPPGIAAGQIHRVRRVTADRRRRRLRPARRRSARRGGRPGAPVGVRRRWPAARPSSPAPAPSASANACAIHRGWAWTKARWPTGSVVGDGASSPTHDCSSRVAMVRSTPLTKPARAESNSIAGLLDGGGHRGVRVDAGAQQLVGPESQQVQQHRVDVVRSAGPRRRR